MFIQSVSRAQDIKLGEKVLRLVRHVHLMSISLANNLLEVCRKVLENQIAQ